MSLLLPTCGLCHSHCFSSKSESITRLSYVSCGYAQDDRYFLSGSLDGKLRLWNIPDKRVALWNEIEGIGKSWDIVFRRAISCDPLLSGSHLITAANFCMNGKMAVVGTYDGRCIFYETEV